MKTLLLLNGPMGVGKSAVCRALLGRITPSVYLDGDWCWSMSPFRVTDETREMVMDNITAMLSRFLTCSELDYVIFGWVMHRPEIAQSILNRLDLRGVRVFHYTLLCAEHTLRGRIEKDIQAGLRTPDVLERSLAYLPLYAAQHTIKIMTDELAPRQAAETIAGQIESGQRPL